ncbi:MAG: hypothetical protein MJD61_08990 [Proteobacteria bacterium]|nr:hypothetical protein [Pseudomonadota bacterium]
MNRILLAICGAAAALGGGCFLEEFRAPPVGAPLDACQGLDSNPLLPVSFSLEIMPILMRDEKMAGCSCHQPGSANTKGLEETELDPSSHGSLMRGGTKTRTDIVIPFDPCRSMLYLKLVSPPFGGRMPDSGPPYLSAAEAQLFHDWIAEGAFAN